MLRRLDFRATRGRIGTLFMVGSACFALPSLPAGSSLLGPTVSAATYFLGSIFFTTAGALQLAASTRHRDRLAAGIQLVGTVFFNVNTLLALIDAFKPITHYLVVWAPDAWGSVAFLISSVISWVVAFDDANHGRGHAYAHRRTGRWPRLRHRLASALRRDWRTAVRDLRSDEIWIAGINLAGSVAFGVAAAAALIVAETTSVLEAAAVNTWTLAGAACFFTAAFLLVEER